MAKKKQKRWKRLCRTGRRKPTRKPERKKTACRSWKTTSTIYRVSFKFSNGFKCQYLSKYSRYFNKICFITFSYSIQSFLHKNCVRGYNEHHFMAILVIPSTYSLAPQIKMITESVTACNERFLGIIFFLSHF